MSIKAIAEKDKERAKDVLSFYIDLYKALIQAQKILRPKRYFCLIVGNRTVKELVLKTDEIICELGRRSVLFLKVFFTEISPIRGCRLKIVLQTNPAKPDLLCKKKVLFYSKELDDHISLS